MSINGQDERLPVISQSDNVLTNHGPNSGETSAKSNNVFCFKMLFSDLLVCVCLSITTGHANDQTKINKKTKKPIKPVAYGRLVVNGIALRSILFWFEFRD